MSREGANESPKEGIACAGGISQDVDRVGREAEKGVSSEAVLGSRAEDHGPEFAKFDDNVRGAFFLKKRAGSNEVVLSGEEAGFGFVEDEEVDLLENLVEVILSDLDPEIHGVGNDELFLRRYLREELELIEGGHVGEDDELGVLDLGRNLDLPVFQDVDGNVVGGAVVHVLMVFARPGEGGLVGLFKRGEVDAIVGKHVEMLLGEVMADDANEVGGGLLARSLGSGEGGKGGAAAEKVRFVSSRGFDVVDGDRAADEDFGHERRV